MRIALRGLIAIPIFGILIFLTTGCASGINDEAAIGQSLRAAMDKGVSLNNEEKKLYEIMNRYRNQKGLHAIPLSPSLTKVAQIHVRDLMSDPPTGKCNMHSWSGGGPWSSCCYTDDHAAAQCMWDKPRELTAYTGSGFEIAYGGTPGYRANAHGALEGWKGSSGHNNVIVNRSIWKDNNWKAVGIGVYGSYAVIWFGEESDTQMQGMLRRE